MSWTKTPPTEPGFYWARFMTADEHWFHVAELLDNGTFAFTGSDVIDDKTSGYEFWKERLLPPHQHRTYSDPDCLRKLDNAAPRFGVDSTAHHLGLDPAADARLAEEFGIPGSNALDAAARARKATEPEEPKPRPN